MIPQKANMQVVTGDKPLLPAAAAGNLASTLNQQERGVVVAANSTKLGQMMRSNEGLGVISALLSIELKKMPYKAGFNAAAQSTEQEQQMYISEMIGVLKAYKYIGVDELKIVIAEGMIGNYGDFFGLNARVLNDWLKKYTGTTRMQAMQKQLQHEQKQLDVVEEGRKMEEALNAGTANRARLCDNFYKVLDTYKEKLEALELNYSYFPENIDYANHYANKLLEKWDKTLGFTQAVRDQVWEEEKTRAKKESRMETGFNSPELVKRRAAYNYKSRLFRERLAIIANSGQRIEDFLKKAGI